ncbi:MAG: hypothetical protein FJX72_07570 [Armatimonadetes bacterium]|nr:hypothetical protein [Armatimonadota bacterium]
MSEAGYDAMAVGNREFHFSQVGFRAKARRARFPLVSANLRSRVTGVTPPCSPFVWLDTPGMGRVAVFGLTVPMITERMTVRHISPFVFDDPVATCRAMSAQLRPNADLLICLSHCGLAVDRLLAEAASNVDVIVGGHTHAELPTGERIGQTLIVQAGSHARLYGIVRLEGSRDDWRTSCELAPL